MDTPPPLRKPRPTVMDILAAVFCLAFAGTSLIIFARDLCWLFKLGRLLAHVPFSLILLSLFGSMAVALGGFAILTRRGWGYAPACMGLVVVLCGRLPFVNSIYPHDPIFLFAPGIGAFILVLIHRIKWARNNREQRLAQGRVPSLLGFAQGCAAMGLGLAGTGFSFRLWLTAYLLALESHGPNLVNPRLIEWLLRVCFLVLATAACLRLDNHRWSLYLARPSLAMLLVLTWLAFGFTLNPLSLPLYALSTALLILTLADGLAGMRRRTP